MVTSGGGLPRRVGQSTIRMPVASARNVVTATAIAVLLLCTMLIGISAGFIPMNMTM
jgi:hypothetical protein